MPMDFPDLASLKTIAKLHKFRKLNDGESEAHYRLVLADYVESLDFVESCEIRNKVGWDKFTEEQNREILIRRFRK